MRKISIALLCLFSLLIIGCTDDSPPKEQTYVPPDGEGNWILVDNIHTTKQNPSDYRLRRDDYAYQGMHGFHRLFDHLDANGYPWTSIRYTEQEERLSLDVLDKFKVLFINLVSSENPDFNQAEIDAIHTFVEEGGGLFVVADHTNVYYSSERLNPILVPMGVEVPYTTAMDAGPEFAIGGGAWIKIRTWKSGHPVTDGVSVASYQTGCSLVSDDAVAWLSPSGFGDNWIENEDNLGFYGNWTYDQGELSGALPVVTAGEFGEGRLVVVGDQNAFGDEWVMVGHNFELATNSFEWLAKNEFAEPRLREIPLKDQFVVGFDLDHSEWNIGTERCSGYFPFYIDFNRTSDVTGRGIVAFDGKEDALVFTNPAKTFTQDELTQIGAYLDAGKTIAIMFDVVSGAPGGKQLIEEFVPDFTVSAGDQSIGIADLPDTSGAVEMFVGDGLFTFQSEQLGIDSFSAAGHFYEAGVSCPRQIEDSTPYMYKVTSSSGSPFMSAKVDGEDVDVARIFDVRGGQVVVFLQDGFLRNETLGWERQEPSPATGHSHQINYAFIDWLKTQ